MKIQIQVTTRCHKSAATTFKWWTTVLHGTLVRQHRELLREKPPFNNSNRRFSPQGNAITTSASSHTVLLKQSAASSPKAAWCCHGNIPENPCGRTRLRPELRTEISKKSILANKSFLDDFKRTHKENMQDTLPKKPLSLPNPC